jgi:hypothetical protein
MMQAGTVRSKSENLWVWGLIAASVVAVSGYLAASALTYKIGFPLDDAWIHQTYARNLATRFEFAYIPGLPSAGSTSPLWSFFLAIGYIFINGPFPWGYILGTAGLAGVAIVGELIFRAALPEANHRIPWMGLFLALEWHLVWAAGSGMETILFSCVTLLVFWLIYQNKLKSFWIGILIGLAVWIRPDGLTLLGPAGFVLLLQSKPWKERGRDGFFLATGFLILFLPYLGFNLSLSGKIWPNTFYAKQVEYAQVLQVPFLLRYARLVRLGFIGPAALFIPGIITIVVRATRAKEWPLFGFLLWWAGYLGIYAAMLPVEYQHGRYIMAAMPVSFVLGGIGTAVLLSKMWVTQRLGFVLSRVWMLSLVGLWAGFYFLGAQTYSTDVAIIESEMVKTAQWVREDTRPDDLIAVHDIGAMGYYGERKIVDLAGLVTPEVIPFLRDEDRLSQYLDESGVAYLVTLKGWYPEMESQADCVYQSMSSFSPKAGGTNMAVYRWIRREKQMDSRP